MITLEGMLHKEKFHEYCKITFENLKGFVEFIYADKDKVYTFEYTEPYEYSASSVQGTKEQFKCIEGISLTL